MLHLFILGQERCNDSMQLGTIMQPMLDASSGINPLIVQVKQARIGTRGERLVAAPSALHTLSGDIQKSILSSSPDVTMSDDASLMKVLMALLDTPVDAYQVHQQAYQVLSRLQTWQPLVDSLRCAMADSAHNPPHEDVAALFHLPGPSSHSEENGSIASWQPEPGAVLYTLEALFALMEPAILPKPGLLLEFLSGNASTLCPSCDGC